MAQTPIAKLLPPARPPGFIARAALAGRMTSALERRLTVITAEAGFGKSTLLASWWEVAPCAWYTIDQGDRDLSTFVGGLADSLRLRVPHLPADLSRAVEGGAGPEADVLSRADALASRFAEILEREMSADLMVVLDDVHELSGSTQSFRFVEALYHHAPRMHVVLSGRRRPPFRIERLRGRGQLVEIGPDQLAFSSDELRELLLAQLGEAAGVLASELHQKTGGWPAAVVLAVEALRDSTPQAWTEVLEHLHAQGAPLFRYLAEEVFGRRPAAMRELVRRVALFEWFTPELCEAIGIARARPIVSELMQQGMFVVRLQDGSVALRPLVREFALEQLPLPDATIRELRLAAAEWLIGRGQVAAAAGLLTAAGAHERLASLLRAEGPALLATGRVSVVLEACTALPAEHRSAAIAELEGDARQTQGDWSGALACFDRAAGTSGQIPARLAWRIGLIHYLRGELEGALAAYRRGEHDEEAQSSDRARLLAWMAAAHWLRAEVEPCRTLAAEAFQLASASGDPRALAAAHTALAMLAALDGDRRANDAHYLWALRAAEEASDVLQIIRIRTNRSSHFIEEGSYQEGLKELETAIPLAELGSFSSFLGLGLSNRGDAHLHTGRLDEAMADFEASRSIYQRVGSSMVSYPLAGIGDVYRIRGNLTQARLAFEEAVSASQVEGDIHGLAPALSGLARVVAAEDLGEARQLAERAVACGAGLGYVAALLARGWVACLAGEKEQAGTAATEAISVAQSRRDRAGLAEALMLAALSDADPPSQVGRLQEATAIWKDIGDPLGEATARLALAATRPGERSSAQGRQAERQLETLGLRLQPAGAVAAGAIAMLARSDPVSVRIESLGRFAVLREGQVIPVSEWQSRRARDLLKLLVARRGRPVPRPLVMETLWPEEESDRVANRLSVALSTIRTVLDPDRRFAPGEFVVADKDSVALNVDRVDVDLERFLAAAARGLGRSGDGDAARSLAHLEAAEVAYSGDFLEENPYDDWAVPAREEARAAYLAVARALALQAVRRGDPDAAVRYLLRILELDRFDEEAQLGLVSALASGGRHGEAHRHYLNYRRSMDELGVEPSPFPAGSRVAPPVARA